MTSDHIDPAAGVSRARRFDPREISNPGPRMSALKAAVVIAGLVSLGVAAAPVKSVMAQPYYPLPFMEHDGTYIVGKDIRPGLYLTLGGAGANNCSWMRISAADNGEDAAIIQRSESNEAQYVWIDATDKAFNTKGCQTWSIGSRSATQIAPGPKTCIYPLTGCVNPDENRPRP